MLDWNAWVYRRVFHAKVESILQWATNVNLRHQRNERITISQAALSALTNPKGTSKLVREYRKLLADSNRLSLYWVWRHSGIIGTEKADECARTYQQLHILALNQLWKWINEKQREYWKTMQQTLNKQGKPSARNRLRKELKNCFKKTRISYKYVQSYSLGLYNVNYFSGIVGMWAFRSQTNKGN